MRKVAAVERFTIHDDISKTQDLIIRRCRKQIRKARILFSVLAILTLTTVLLFIQHIIVHPLLPIIAGLSFLIIAINVFTIVDVDLDISLVSYINIVTIHNILTSKTFGSYEELYNCKPLRKIMNGIHLLNTLNEYDVNHVSLDIDKNRLCFIFKNDSGYDICQSYEVNTENLTGNESKVNIVVDACFIKAIPVI